MNDIKISKIWAFGWLFLLVFAVYGNSLQNRFVLDDYTMLLNNEQMHQWHNVAAVLKGGDSPDSQSLKHYRPVSIVFRMALYQLFGNQAFYYHLINIFLFILNGWILFLLFDRLIRNQTVALLAATLYCVHPIHTTAVNFVSAHEVMLFGIFSSLTVLFFLSALEKTSRFKSLFLSLIFFGLSLFTQEITAILPLLLFCIATMKDRYPWRKAVQTVSPYLLVLFGYIFFKLYFIHTSSQILLSNISGTPVSFFNYICALTQLILWYCGQLFYPRDIVLIWSNEAIANFGNYSLVIGCALLALCSLLLWRWKRDIKSLALIWIAIGFAPVSILCFVYYSAMGFVIEPHWFFFTSSGFFLLLALFLWSLRNSRWKKGIGMMIIALVFFWGKTTHDTNYFWKDENTHARYWLSVVPHNPYALRALGNSEKDPHQGAVYLKAALQYIQHYQLYQELGQIYANMKEFALAKENLEHSLRLNPHQTAPYNTLGVIAVTEKHMDEAEKLFKQALAVSPKNTSARLNLSDLYVLGKKFDQAIDILNEGLALDLALSARKNILVTRILLLYEVGRRDESLRDCQALLAQVSGPDTLLLLSDAFYQRGHPEVALEMLKECIKQFPRKIEAYVMCGVILANQEDYTSAIMVWERGLQQDYKNQQLQKNIVQAKQLLAAQLKTKR